MSWRAQGMRAWLLQRLTAVYLLWYGIFFGFYISQSPVHGFESWRALFIHPVSNIATAVFFYSLLYHAWVGIRDILIDYVPLAYLRFFLWIAMTFGLSILAVWVSMILFSVVSL